MKSSFEDTLIKTGFVTAQINVGDRQYCFLVDTGSNQNSITAELYEDNASICQEVSRITIIGMNGNPVKQLLVGMPYHYSSVSSSDHFFVMSSKVFQSIEKEVGVKLYGILGSPFLYKHKAIIDYSRMTLLLESNELRSDAERK